MWALSSEMKIYFGQIYVEPGVEFPFSHLFQQRLSEEASALVGTPDSFTREYGDEWSLMFRISAKRRISRSEIHGPAVFRKTKDVEYTVVLPFDVVQNETNAAKAALRELLCAVLTVLKGYGASTARLEEREARLADEIVADPTMFKQTAAEHKGPNQSADRMPGSSAPGGSGAR
jgi:hypothetical protein